MQFRRVRREIAAEQRVLTVFCSRLLQVVELKQCRRCEHCHGLAIDPSDRGTWLRCSGSSESTTPNGDGAGPAETPGAAANDGSPSLSRIMTTPVRSVEPDATLSDLTALFLETGISAAPVVNGEGRAVGIVSKTDILRSCHEGRQTPGGRAVFEAVIAEDGDSVLGDLPALRVRDVMTHLVFCLDQEASLKRAAALMAYEGIHRIVVTGPDQIALGIVSSLDILRWMAREGGYVLPAHSAGDANGPVPGKGTAAAETDGPSNSKERMK